LGNEKKTNTVHSCLFCFLKIGDVLNTRDYVSVIAQSKAFRFFDHMRKELPNKPIHVILVKKKKKKNKSCVLL